jgi:hypothetical protein
MDPAEQSELLLQVATFKRQYKANETNGVKRKANEAVVGRETGELGIREHDMLGRAISAAAIMWESHGIP